MASTFASHMRDTLTPRPPGTGRRTARRRMLPALLLAVPVALVLAACGGSDGEAPASDERVAAIDPATGEPRARGPMAPEPADPRALAFGHVSAPDGAVQALMFFRDGWVSEDPLPDPLTVPVEPNGDFVVPNLEPGTYYLIAYRGRDGWIDLVYIDHIELEAALREVAPGEVAFLGSYGLVRPPTAGPPVMVPQDTPSEQKLLVRLAERSRNTPWEGRIAERLAERP